jgi:micrococcal nuclease
VEDDAADEATEPEPVPAPASNTRLHILWAASVLAALIGGFVIGRISAPDTPPPLAQEASRPAARCLRVLDGDTIRIEWQGRNEDVRMLGIDCPETKRSRKLQEQAQKLGIEPDALQRYGEIARKTTENWLLNRDVHIIFAGDDVRRDSFGRLLAYVEQQGIDIGERLLLGGNAMLAEYDVHPRNETYRLFEAEARRDKKGIWRAQ